MKKQGITVLIVLALITACKEQNSSTELIQAQNKRIDSLLQRTALLEKQQEKPAINPVSKYQSSDSHTVISVRKFLVSKITCIVSIPEYRKLETEAPDYDAPITDIETMKAAEKLRQQRNGNLHEIVYEPKKMVFYSEIKEVTGYNEEKKYRFLDIAENSLRRKNENVQKILKRECLVYSSYAEASQALEAVEQINTQ